MSDLFLDKTHPLVFTKLAAPIKLSDNPDNWQKEVASEIFKQVPFLADYAVNVIIEKADPERGYAFGMAEVMNQTDAPEASQQEMPRIIVPLIIKDRLLLPLDVFMDGKQVFPLTDRRAREHLFRTDTMELSTRKPQDQGMVDQLYPPLRTNYGYGNAVATGTGGMGKMAGVLDKVKRYGQLMAGGAKQRVVYGHRNQGQMVSDISHLGARPANIGKLDKHLNPASVLEEAKKSNTARLATGVAAAPVVAGAGAALAHNKEKKASLLDTILPTVPAADVDAFISAIDKSEAVKLAANQNPAFYASAMRVAAAPCIGVEKTAEALVASIKPTVVQLEKLASGNFKVKWANAGAFAPQEGIVPPDQAAGLAGSDRVVRMNPGEAITVSTDMAKKETLEDEKLEQVREFGCYRVQNAETGEPMVGWVMPIMDFEMQTLPLYLFVDVLGNYSVQDEIAGSRVLGSMEDFMGLFGGQEPKGMEAPPEAAPQGGPEGMPKMAEIPGAGVGGGEEAPPEMGMPEEAPAPMPQGEGAFINIANERALSLLPVTIRATTTGADGSTAYHAEDIWAQPITLHIAPGSQVVMDLGEGSYAIPDSFQWLSLKTAIHLVKSPLEMQKVAEARTYPSSVLISVGGRGEYHLKGNPLEFLDQADCQFLKTAQAEFLLVAMGMSPFDVKEKLKEASRYGQVKVAGLNQIMPLSMLHRQMVKKAAEALGDFPYHLRRDLIKEAAALEDGETVDNILSMGFINPENISTFANYLPELDETASKLAEMLVAARLGMNLIPEGAAERAMKALDEVIEGLRMLQQKAQG